MYDTKLYVPMSCIAQGTFHKINNMIVGSRFFNNIMHFSIFISEIYFEEKIHLYTIHKYELKSIRVTLHSNFVQKYHIFFGLQLSKNLRYVQHLDYNTLQQIHSYKVSF